MHLANQEHFPERMQVHNGLLCSLVGCVETTLAASRNKLKQLGRIDYKGRQKHPAIYFINYFTCDNPNYDQGGDTGRRHSQGQGDNSKKQGYDDGNNDGINTGYNTGIHAGNIRGTYINKTRLNEAQRGVIEFGNNWRTSARARMAVAQEVLDAVYRPEERERDGVCAGTARGDLHELIDEYLAEGLTPDAIVAACGAVPVEQWSGRLWEALQCANGERKVAAGVVLRGV
jgi:hypothetical protein